MTGGVVYKLLIKSESKSDSLVTNGAIVFCKMSATWVFKLERNCHSNRSWFFRVKMKWPRQKSVKKCSLV